LLPGKGDSAILYGTRSEFAAKGLSAFVSCIETHPLFAAVIENLFCFLSAELCVFAFNYGRDINEYDAAILNTLVTQSLFFKLLSDLFRQTGEDVIQTVNVLARAAESNDVDRGNHTLRVGEFCALLARQLGLNEGFVSAIQLQARLHDVGNIYIPAEILKKNGVPNFHEWEIIRTHTQYGAQIIGEHPHLAMARTYKPAMDHKTVCEKISQGDERIKPEFFDPAVLKAFLELAPQFAEVFARLKD
jgi:response regulator RpfG family c-di-GMP phosphodiesterase